MAGLVCILVLGLAAVLGEVPERYHRSHGSDTNDVGPNEFALVPSGFTIEGGTVDVLRPGVASDLRLTITNPHPFAVAVQEISVTFEGTAQCDGPSNFVVSRPFSGPVMVPSGSTVLPLSRAPRVTMLDLDTPQDGCKASAMTLHYGGTATRA